MYDIPFYIKLKELYYLMKYTRITTGDYLCNIHTHLSYLFRFLIDWSKPELNQKGCTNRNPIPVPMAQPLLSNIHY